jgi:hypothetical protein
MLTQFLEIFLYCKKEIDGATFSRRSSNSVIESGAVDGDTVPVLPQQSFQVPPRLHESPLTIPCSSTYNLCLSENTFQPGFLSML